MTRPLSARLEGLAEFGHDGGGGPGAPPSRGGARCRLAGQRRPGLHDAGAHLGRRPRRGARRRHALPALARQSPPRRGDRREAAARERRGGNCVTGDRHAGRQVGRVPAPWAPCSIRATRCSCSNRAWVSYRADGDAVGRRPGRGRARAAGLHDHRGGAPGSDHASDDGHSREQSEQPDGPGPDWPRGGRARPPWPGTRTCMSSATRSTSTSCTTGGPIRACCAESAAGGAHDPCQRFLEGVRDDRLAPGWLVAPDPVAKLRCASSRRR